MRDDRWQQIDSLFDEALELTESARGNLLDRECAGDAELRRAVERLLALEFEAENFLAESIVSTPLEGSEDSQPRSVKVDDLAGLSIGPYRLIRPLGRGGMGIVYLAYRENPYHQEVAIKLVRRGLLSVQARRRLEAERQVLAQLEHPNIARLYDGGTTEDGIPYLVMERVIGLPIDDYCDEQRLSIRERLDLVKQVLAAVAHAHHHLSVHCDIKPSNILVTADAIPKLLDFGIVKLLSPKGNEEITVTGPGRRPLTLAYASPEQVQGETITTATDLYSVGVLLHQLLCGHLPYELASGPESGLGRAIVEDDPIPPSRFSLGLRGKGREDGEISESSEALAQSRRLTPRELELCLRGDLDAIVRKAIRKEPHLRYTSAETFADDIDRYLE
ncbi:MAG: serine/threonine protein kinase, partial [Thermoanaerobaculia bacterium]|nr:serine/threonine protein kinase [Thermoanaerobaculia bacterium]